MRKILQAMHLVTPAGGFPSRLDELLSRAPPGALTPHRLFREADDDLWFWLHTDGYRLLPLMRAIIPDLPAAQLQRQFTGNAGDETLRDGFRSYRLFRQLAQEHLGDWSREHVLDFGCGWGRILRFFLRDVEPECLLGIDCTPEMIEFCRRSNQWARFELVAPTQPTALPPGQFGLIYAYSVFSHLAEATHKQWLAEFHRLLRPGGLLLITTRPREFIVMLAQQRKLGPLPAGLPRAFEDDRAWLARYDTGEFCFEPTGGGGVLDSSFFGETAIPASYVQREWTRWFEFRNFINDRSLCEQAVIVVRKPGA